MPALLRTGGMRTPGSVPPSLLLPCLYAGEGQPCGPRMNPAQSGILQFRRFVARDGGPEVSRRWIPAIEHSGTTAVWSRHCKCGHGCKQRLEGWGC